MNRYVVKANPQEIRHATKPGAFATFVEDLAKEAFWDKHDFFTKTQRKRMKVQELCAELTILMIEGPQDKKASVDLYYDVYSDMFREGKRARTKLRRFLHWIDKYIPNVEDTFLGKPVDFYSLVGALQDLAVKAPQLPKTQPRALELRIRNFGQDIRSKRPSEMAARYAEAASRQTDNLRPRQTRIEIITRLLTGRL
jgi:hypothetical protein